ncbi:ATPase synthesis protein 25, mitochondrial [Schizosaccharomyces pombe]
MPTYRFNYLRFNKLCVSFFRSKFDKRPFASQKFPENLVPDNLSNDANSQPEKISSKKPWYVDEKHNLFPKKAHFDAVALPPIPKGAPNFLADVLNLLKKKYYATDLSFVNSPADSFWCDSDLILLASCNCGSEVVSATNGLLRLLKQKNVGPVNVDGLTSASRRKILERRMRKRSNLSNRQLNTSENNWTCLSIENFGISIHVITKNFREYYKLDNIEHVKDETLYSDLEHGKQSRVSLTSKSTPDNSLPSNFINNHSNVFRRSFHTCNFSLNSAASLYCDTQDILLNVNSQNLTSTLEKYKKMHLQNPNNFSLDFTLSIFERLRKDTSLQLTTKDINTLFSTIALSPTKLSMASKHSKNLVSERMLYLSLMYKSLVDLKTIDSFSLKLLFLKFMICSCMVKGESNFFLDNRIFLLERIMNRYGIPMTIDTFLLMQFILAKSNRWSEVWRRWDNLRKAGVVFNERLYNHVYLLAFESKNERVINYVLTNIFEDMVSQSPPIPASKLMATSLKKCVQSLPEKYAHSFPSVRNYIAKMENSMTH